VSQLLSSLEVFPRYTRESYEAKFGVQAPPCDGTKPLKAWFDPAGAGVYHQLVGVSGATPPTFAALIMTPAEAKSINLPRAYRYPEYIIPPTPGTLLIQGVKRVPMFAQNLSTSEQANGLAVELTAAGWLVSAPYEIDKKPKEGPSDVTVVYEWNGETRRHWMIDVDRGELNRVPYNVGQLLAERNRAGAGSPGHWEPPSSGHFRWQADPQVVSSSKEGPVPVRLLNSDEEFQHAFGLGWVVVKKADVPVEPGQAKLDEILAGIKALRQFFGV